MKYRFDDAYEKVYELANGAYIFIGSYYAFGIDSPMSESEKIACAEYDEADEEKWARDFRNEG